MILKEIGNQREKDGYKIIIIGQFKEKVCINS